MSRIAFFGTPDFAATIFEGLISYCAANGHTIGFAACQPDRPKGRTQNIEPPPVKVVANRHQIDVFQPLTLKAGTPDGDSFFETLKNASLDLAIVVAYGRIIPKRMLDLPARGFINVHASLLPRWRGASPIQRALQAGDKETGISLMELVPEMDAGDVYQMCSLPISEKDDATSLTTRLAQLGLETLLGSLEKILSGTLPKVSQVQSSVTFAPKLVKEDGLISWDKSASEIINHCRAMVPWPQSYTFLNESTVKLFGAHLPNQEGHLAAGKPGTIVSIGDVLITRCSDGAVAFDEIQFEGKRKMSVRDGANGHLLRLGDQFSTAPTSI